MTSTGQSDLDAIAAIRQNLEAAENAHDPDAVAIHLADDVVIMVPDYAVREGKTAAVAFVREMMEWMREYLDRRIEYVSGEVTIVGDLAFDRGTFSFVVSAKTAGTPETVTGKYFWLLRRGASDGWKIWRSIVSRDEPPEECADEDIPASSH